MILLRFRWLTAPTPGPVSLRFGDPGIRLEFRWPIDPTPGPVRLRFGSPIPPPPGERIDATLATVIPAPSIAGLTFAGTGEQAAPVVVIEATLAATLPTPAIPGLDFSGAGQQVQNAALATTLPAPTFPGLVFAGEGRDTAVQGTIAANLPAPTLPALALAANLTQNLDLPDNDGPGIRLPHRNPRRQAVALPARHAQGRKAHRAMWMPNKHRPRVTLPLGMPHRHMERLERPVRVPQAHALRRSGCGLRLAHQEALRTHQWTTLRHAEGLPIQRGIGTPWAETIRLRARVRLQNTQQPKDASGIRLTERQGLRLVRALIERAQQAAMLPVGPCLGDGSLVLPPEPPEPPDQTVRLIFCIPYVFNETHLRFLFCDTPEPPEPPIDGPIIIPIREVYVVLNDVQLVRALDGIEVPCESLALTLDAGSWVWGFSARLPASAQERVEPDPDPVELLAWINGTAFRILVESIARERVFADTRIRVSGRGHQAVLDAPYAPIQTFSNDGLRTSQQLMDEVLTVNGVPLGWTIDWGLEAWNVPSGVFSHQGTYLSALLQITRAGGGVLIPHASLQSFAVRHRYPVAPWDWQAVTPDLVLPAAAVARESLTWTEKPVYNRVFVSGLSQGILGQVTRAGTAGDLIAPMVVDPLITAPAAARQRGLAVLADTGRQLEVGLRLPIFPETQIVAPGTFIEYQDEGLTRIGLVRSTQIDVGLPEVWQTLGVETRA